MKLCGYAFFWCFSIFIAIRCSIHTWRSLPLFILFVSAYRSLLPTQQLTWSSTTSYAYAICCKCTPFCSVKAQAPTMSCTLHCNWPHLPWPESVYFLLVNANGSINPIHLLRWKPHPISFPFCYSIITLRTKLQNSSGDNGCTVRVVACVPNLRHLQRTTGLGSVRSLYPYKCQGSPPSGAFLCRSWLTPKQFYRLSRQTLLPSRACEVPFASLEQTSSP